MRVTAALDAENSQMVPWLDFLTTDDGVRNRSPCDDESPIQSSHWIKKEGNYWHKPKNISLSISKKILKLSAVRKVPETITFPELRNNETVGSIVESWNFLVAEIIHWIISPNVRTHQGKFLIWLCLQSERAQNWASFGLMKTSLA